MIWSDLGSMALVLSILTVMIAALHRYQKQFAPHPEVVRKILHVTMGLVSLSFPWLFQSVWSVVILAIMSGGGLSLIKRVDYLRNQFGSVLCAVKRNTWGEVSFAAAIAILFALTHHEPLLYCIPVLTLTMADSLSALVGISIGKHRYTTMEGTKTVEGSLAFFLMACAVTIFWLLMFGSMDPLKATVIGILIGGLVMMFEAASWKGLDNLFVPLSTYFLLSAYVPMDLPNLVMRLVTALSLLVLSLAWRRNTALNDGATLGATVLCYIFAAAGGYQWLIAPLSMLLLHKYMLPKKYQGEERSHTVYSVIAVAATGLIWLLAQRITGIDFFLQFTFGFAANMAMIAVAHLRQSNPVSSDVGVVLLSSTASWTMFFVPFLLFRLTNAGVWTDALMALPLVVLTASVFYMFGRDHKEHLAGKSRWIKQGGLAALLSPLSLMW